MTAGRLDLAHALSIVLRAAVAAEGPILAAHDLEMWDYSVLAALARGPAPAQAELAARVRRDQTRLIPILDRLEARGLLLRRVDPADRRHRVVELTGPGRDVVADCRAGIWAMEEQMLAAFPPDDVARFRDVLERLAEGS